MSLDNVDFVYEFHCKDSIIKLNWLGVIHNY